MDNVTEALPTVDQLNSGNDTPGEINVQGVRFYFTGWKPRQGSPELAGQWILRLPDGRTFWKKMSGVTVDTSYLELAKLHEQALLQSAFELYEES